MFLRKAFYCALLLFSLQSCSNELDLTAPWKDIPIVYGILSAGDTAHYIRVEKAFLDPQKSAFSLAQIADSLYYPDAVVKLQRLSDGAIFQLERVDGNKEGYVREGGIFAEAPNYLYKIKSTRLPLAGGERMRLILERGENSEPVTAETLVLPLMEVTRPLNSPINSWKNLNLAWRPNSTETVIFDVKVKVNYRELRLDDPNAVPQDKSVVWNPIRNLQINENQNNTTMLVELSGDAFFSFLGETLSHGEPVRRSLTGVNFLVNGGGREIGNFFEITLANQGITGSQDPPVFTNLSEGRGVFSSLSKIESINYQLGSEARDSLLFGRFTIDLGFQ